MQWWQVNYTVLFCFSTVFFLFLSLFTVKNLFIHTFFVFSKFSYFDVVLGKKLWWKLGKLLRLDKKNVWRITFSSWSFLWQECFFLCGKLNKFLYLSNVKNKTDFDIKSCLPFLFLCFFVVVVLAVRNDTSAKPFYKSKHWRSKQNKKRKSPFVLSCSKMVHPFCLCFVLKTWKRNDAKKKKRETCTIFHERKQKKGWKHLPSSKKLSFWQANFLFWQQQKKKLFWSSVKKKFSVH